MWSRSKGNSVVGLTVALSLSCSSVLSAQDHVFRATASVGQDYHWLNALPGAEAGWGIDLSASGMISPSWALGGGLRWFDYGASTSGADIAVLFGEGRYYGGESHVLGLPLRFFTGGRVGYLRVKDPRADQSTEYGAEVTLMSGWEVRLIRSLALEFNVLPRMQFYQKDVAVGMSVVTGVAIHR